MDGRLRTSWTGRAAMHSSMRASGVRERAQGGRLGTARDDANADAARGGRDAMSLEARHFP